MRSRRHGAVAIATLMALLLGTVFAGTAQAASTTVKKTFSSTTPVTIPDWTPPTGNQGGIGMAESSVEVTGLLGNITKVTASFYITHGSTQELDGAIIAPDGQTYAYLFNQHPSDGSSLGTSCADADRTTFDDAAGTDIGAGTSPFVGTYRPDAGLGLPLSVFNGNGFTGGGTWALSVFDYVPGNTGNIECWSLFIETDQGQSLRFDNANQVPLVDALDPGGPGVGQSTVSASGLSGSVSSVSVTVWVTHTQDSDLDVILVGPTGKQVKLAARVGGNGNDFGRSCAKPTVFDDAAKTSIASGIAPFQGTFRPSEPLAGFNGTDGNGTWALRVVDNAATHTGQINCWSLSVTSVAPSASTSMILTPRLAFPRPLVGAYDYPYFSVKNNTADTLNNVTLTTTFPATLTDIREDAISFPACDVNVTKLTCTWASLAPGETVLGGAIAKVGASKKGTVCFDGSVIATGVNAVKASACFTNGEYPAPDQGTGYAVGDKAHNLALLDQDGNPASLADYAGKYVLLQFTAVWCGPSNVEVPQDRDEIQALNDSGAMGVDVVYLTVLIDGPNPGTASTKNHATNWANKFDLTSPVLYTANDSHLTAEQHHLSYSISTGEPGSAFPTSIFIRPDGTIFSVRVGVEPEGDTTDRFLNDLP